MNTQEASKSVLAGESEELTRVDSLTIKAWQIEDETAYVNTRWLAHHRIDDLAIRNHQNRAARRAAITRLALFDLIDRKAAILRDWCTADTHTPQTEA